MNKVPFFKCLQIIMATLRQKAINYKQLPERQTPLQLFREFFNAFRITIFQNTFNNLLLFTITESKTETVTKDNFIITNRE